MSEKKWPTVSQLLANGRATVGRHSADASTNTSADLLVDASVGSDSLPFFL